MNPVGEWWRGFFDADYLRLWEGAEAPEKTDKEVAGLWALLDLKPGARVLDAPCGYGRIARGLAVRGAQVVGMDLSAELLASAERRRGDLPAPQLRYLNHDLRTPLPESGFDVALNIFSSLGYGTEDDDRAILRNLLQAVVPRGRVFIEGMHRDRAAVLLAGGQRPADRLADGTLLIEQPRFDPIAGRVDTTWYWSGPAGSGQKSASIRVYSATELVRLVESAGLRVRATLDGCSTDPFVKPGQPIGNRLGLLAERD
jgi:SAM-dependent methyltransferase